MDTISEEQNNLYEIYIIKNILNKKSYIGVAKNYIKGNRNKYYLYGGMGRFQRHISNAFSTNEKSSNDCPELYSAIREFGSELFICKILKVVSNNPKKHEKKYILKFDTHNPKNGYNVLISTDKPICPENLITFQKKKENGNKERAIGGSMKIKEHSKNLPPNINYRCIINKNSGIKHEGYFVQIKTNGILQNKAFLSDKFTMDEKLEMAIDYLNNIKNIV